MIHGEHPTTTNQTQMIFGAVLAAETTGRQQELATACTATVAVMQYDSVLSSSINSKRMDSIDGPNVPPRIER